MDILKYLLENAGAIVEYETSYGHIQTINTLRAMFDLHGNRFSGWSDLIVENAVAPLQEPLDIGAAADAIRIAKVIDAAQNPSNNPRHSLL